MPRPRPARLPPLVSRRRLPARTCRPVSSCRVIAWLVVSLSVRAYPSDE